MSLASYDLWKIKSFLLWLHVYLKFRSCLFYKSEVALFSRVSNETEHIQKRQQFILFNQISWTQSGHCFIAYSTGGKKVLQFHEDGTFIWGNLSFNLAKLFLFKSAFLAFSRRNFSIRNLSETNRKTGFGKTLLTYQIINSANSSYDLTLCEAGQSRVCRISCAYIFYSCTTELHTPWSDTWYKAGPYITQVSCVFYMTSNIQIRSTFKSEVYNDYLHWCMVFITTYELKVSIFVCIVLEIAINN